MKRLKNIAVLVLLALAGSLFTACQNEEMETMSWRAGSGLHILGADAAEVVDPTDKDDESQEYYVDGFTVKETYEWRLNNAVIPSERNGEFVTLSFATPGDYTLTVTNGKYTGTKTITVE